MDEPGLVLGIWFSKSRGLFYGGASSFAENGGTVIFISAQIYALWIIKDTLFFFQDLLGDDGWIGNNVCLGSLCQFHVTRHTLELIRNV